MKLIAFVLLLASAVCAARASDVGDVLATEHAWCRAFVNRDVAALQHIELDDYTLTASDGTVTTKPDDLADISGSHIRYTLFENRDMKVRVHGDVAIVTGRTFVQGTDDGKPIDIEVQFTDTLIKISGEWRAAAGHVSRIRNGPAR